jgi:hypothetical protein
MLLHRSEFVWHKPIWLGALCSAATSCRFPKATRLGGIVREIGSIVTILLQDFLPQYKAFPKGQAV